MHSCRDRCRGQASISMMIIITGMVCLDHMQSVLECDPHVDNLNLLREEVRPSDEYAMCSKLFGDDSKDDRQSLCFNIFVKLQTPVSGKTITLGVWASDTIGYLKDKIQYTQGIPRDLQQLFQLKNETSVSDYGLMDNEWIGLGRLDGP